MLMADAPACVCQNDDFFVRASKCTVTVRVIEVKGHGNKTFTVAC